MKAGMYDLLPVHHTERPHFQSMLHGLQLGSIQARRMQSESAYIIQEEMPQCVRPSFEEVALRAVVLACRHDARAPVAHEVTDHAVRGYCNAP